MFSFMKKKEIVHDKDLKAILTGSLLPIENVPDETFASKVLGEGIAFEPDGDDTIVAPADGEMITASEDMKHACGIKIWNGMEVLLHIGINTVEMNGDGFTLLVKEGQKVKTGYPLVRFDKDKIQAAGFPVTTMLIITDMGEANSISFSTGAQVTKGQSVVATFE